MAQVTKTNYKNKGPKTKKTNIKINEIYCEPNKTLTCENMNKFPIKFKISLGENKLVNLKLFKSNHSVLSKARSQKMDPAYIPIKIQEKVIKRKEPKKELVISSTETEPQLKVKSNKNKKKVRKNRVAKPIVNSVSEQKTKYHTQIPKLNDEKFVETTTNYWNGKPENTICNCENCDECTQSCSKTIQDNIKIILQKIIDNLAIIVTISCSTSKITLLPIFNGTIELYDHLIDRSRISQFKKYRNAVIQIKSGKYDKLVANNILSKINRNQLNLLKDLD